MILHLSMMIASSLRLRLQIQDITVNGELSRGILLTSTPFTHKSLLIALCVTFSLFARLNKT
jgi:hypothetical protein